jgi:hypothetical protein
MNGYDFTLAGQRLCALGSGALWWPERRMLCVADLHLGKAERHARRGGAALPPYETADTLERLDADIAATGAGCVLCLGDSFDDDAAAQALPEAARLWIARLQAGRSWIWIAGNHDPGPVDLGGTHLAELPAPPLVFRHIATPGAAGEISGHYHPKARIRTRAGTLVRRAFLIDRDRVVLPAYGTYTGGLDCHDRALADLMRADALAVLTGPRPLPVPMPRRAA